MEGKRLSSDKYTPFCDVLFDVRYESTGLQLGPVKCIRVDKEIDEQGHLPYKLLTVPYSKVADLLPESAEAPSITITTATQQAPTGIPTSQQQHQQQDGSPTPAGLTAAMNNNNGNGSISVYAHASAEEQEAARALAQYVLSPALLHLWGYSTPSTTPSMSASASSSSAVHISSTTHTSSSSAAGADGSTAQMEVTQEQELEAQVMQQPEEHEHKQQAAKRVKLSHDPSETASSISNTHPLDITTSSSSSNSVNSNTAGVSGECREYVPASHAEAEGILQRLRASVTTTTTAGATTTEGDSSSQDTAGVPDGYVSTIDTNLKSSAYSILHTTTTSSTTTSAGYTPVLVAAVDCEMCETVGGQLELTRVSLLGHDGRTLLETLVRPRSQITNYLTQYSGITEEMLRDVTVTLEQVMQYIFNAFMILFWLSQTGYNTDMSK